MRHGEDTKWIWNFNSAGLDFFNTLADSACMFEYYKGFFRILRVNSKYAHELGGPKMTKEEALMFSWPSHIDEENGELLQRQIQQAIESKEEVIGETAFFGVLPDNEKVYFRTRLRIVEEQEEHYLFYCALQNITNQIELEQSRLETSEQLNAIMNNINCGVTAITVGKTSAVRFVFANDHYFKMIGYSREDVMKEGFPIFELVHPDDRDRIYKQTMEASLECRPFSCTYRVICADGSIRWHESNISITAIRGIDEPIQLSVAKDITRQMVAVEKEREAADQLKVIIENVNAGVSVATLVNKKIGYIYTNDEYYSIFGYTKEEFHKELPKGLIDLIYPDDLGRVLTVTEELGNNGESSRLEFRIRKKDGSLIWVRSNSSVCHVSGIEAPLHVAIVNDITKEKESEERYQRELQLRRELIRDSAIFYQLNMTRGIIEEYTSVYGDVKLMKAGTEVSDAVRADILKNILEADREKVASTLFLKGLLTNYQMGRSSVGVVYRRRVPKHGIRWMRMTGSIVKRPNTGELIAFISIKDIDVEKKQKMALEITVQEEINAIIVFNVNSGKGFICFREKYSAQEIAEGMFDYELFMKRFITNSVLEEDRCGCLVYSTIKSVQRELEKESNVFFTHRQYDENGSIRRKMVRMFYLDGSKADIVVVKRDITDLYEEEQRQKRELQAAVAAANKANQSKSDFLSRMSHDIRTPLNAVLSFSGVEMMENASEQQLREYLTKIHFAGQYLLGIVNDVLDMSKIEQKKVLLKREPYEFAEFLRTIHTIIDELCKEKKVKFVFHTGAKFFPEIMTDKVRFNQIFVNLLSNAVKFTPQGGTVELSFYPSGEIFETEEEESVPVSSIGHHLSGRTKTVKKKYCNVRFLIKDTGIGMSKDFLPHAFECFTQEYRNDSSERSQGTGLGLSIVYELVQLMNGIISVDSVYGKGSCFAVELPLEISKVYKAEKKLKKKRKTLKGMRVLLCEDNDINAEIAVLLLKKQGCIVDCAQNGSMGLQRFAESEVGFYDVILMDIRMPVMNGIEASKAIRSLRRADAKEVPIIAMTADAFVEDEESSREAGMNGHLSKPVEPEVLYRMISEI